MHLNPVSATPHLHPRHAPQVVKLTWQREGVAGFYRGIGPALLRVMPQSAVTFVVYENVLRALNTTVSQ